MIIGATIGFPCLLYTPRFIIGSIADEKQLTRAGKAQVERKCFDSGVIVDKTGKKFAIAKYRVSKSGPWNLYNYFPDRIFDDYKSVVVDMEISLLEKKNLDMLKEEISELVIKNKWYKSTMEGTKEAFMAHIDCARTVQELINKISVYP